MPRVVHFEIHADDPARARKFYESLFGWTFQEIMPAVYWLITTGPDSEPGINGGLMKRQGGQAGDFIMAYVCTTQVPDIDAAIARFGELEGTVAMPKHAIPGVGRQFYGKDSEGNVFGIHQPDTNAA